MDEHSVPTLAMDEFDWTVRSNQTPPCRTSAPQTSAHAPLFVNPLKAWLYPVLQLPAYVRP